MFVEIEGDMLFFKYQTSMDKKKKEVMISQLIVHSNNLYVLQKTWLFWLMIL